MKVGLDRWGSFVLGAIVTFLTAPAVMRLAFRAGAVDHPSPRRPHEGIKPRMGGLALVAGLAATLGLEAAQGWRPAPPLSFLLLGASVIALLGLLDDIHDLSPLKRLIVQGLAASMVIAGGVTFPVSRSVHDLVGFPPPGFLDHAVTLFWLVGITNAFNLIDGLDFLVLGLAMVAAASLAVLATQGSAWLLPVDLALLAVLAGFAPYNIFPSKAFLGDTGSTLLGFSFASLTLLHMDAVLDPVARVGVPPVLLGLPLIDTTYAVFRRALTGRSLFAADRGHLHHRLLDMGYSMPGASRWLMAHQLVLSMGAVGLALGDLSHRAVSGVLILAAVISLTVRLRLLAPGSLRAGLDLPGKDLRQDP